MKVNERERESLNHKIELLDADKVMHRISLLADSNGLTVNWKQNESINIDQNLININRNINWNQLVMSDRTFIYISKDKLVMKVIDAVQRFSYKPIAFWRDRSSEQPNVAIR
jgi:hypothetical protein